MKNLALTSVFVFIAFQIIFAQQFDDRPKIMVNGEAVVKVQPDQILITFGVETWDKDIIIAKQKNKEIMQKTMSVMKDFNISDKNIQTDYLSVEPRYEDNYIKKDLIGFFIRNTFVVTLSDPERVEDLVTEVLQSGVNFIHNINFQTSEFKKYREQARELALNAAKEKAENMAATLGQLIGDPIQINEGYAGSDWWYYGSWSGWGYGRSSSMNQNVMQNVSNNTESISESIALGKISIKANVSVTFELKK